jgi:hypothetical protein
MSRLDDMLNTPGTHKLKDLQDAHAEEYSTLTAILGRIASLVLSCYAFQYLLSKI